MERDFLGLSSKDSVVAVKEEIVEENCKNAGFGESSGVPWPLSNKLSALPQFKSFKSEHNEKPSKNFEGASETQQFLGSLTASHSVLPSTTSAAGTTEQWINSKVSSSPAQLTMFYAGTMNVFDDISPEKAQAIIFLAGNGSILPKMNQTKLDMKAPISRHSAADQEMVNQSLNVPHSSGLRSPMLVSSQPIDQSSVAAAQNDDFKAPSTLGMVELPIMASSFRSAAASHMLSSAVPQARKASLARFLEKRKERVMNAAPYTLSKNSADSGTTSGPCSSSVSSGKEISDDI